MLKIFSVLLALLISSSDLFGENPEISKKLLYAQKIDKQNKKLGESIDPEIRLKLIKQMNIDAENIRLYSGFEFLESKIESDSVKFFYRAYADVSYYSEEQIKEVKEFLIKERVFFCKVKNFRKYLFLLNPKFEYIVVDKLNKPFIDFKINKETCRGEEPFGRDRALKERDVRKLIKQLN